MHRSTGVIVMVVATLAMGACKDKQTAKEPAKPDCGSSIGGAIDRMVVDAKPKMPPDAFANVTKAVPAMKAAITGACTKDAWAAAVLVCLDGAQSQRDMNACTDKLTPDQKTHYDQAISDVMTAWKHP